MIWDALHGMVSFVQYKKLKKNHGGVLLLVKLQATTWNLLKVSLLHVCFSRFLIAQMLPNRAKHSHRSVFSILSIIYGGASC